MPSSKRGALLNYTTSIEASKSGMEVVGLLAVHGASKIMLDSDGKGGFTGVSFAIRIGTEEHGFRLPLHIDTVYNKLADQYQKGLLRSTKPSKEQAERVAWRILKDWVEAQVAIIESGMAQPAEVFLPYLLTPGNDRTLFERMEERLALPQWRR